MAPSTVTRLAVLATLVQIAVLVTTSSLPTVTPQPDLIRRRNGPHVLDKRQPGGITTELTMCGYLNGNPTQFRTADSGFDCRVDTANGLWGFCPTTVIAATDCGLAGFCQDGASCSNVCGSATNPSLTTFTCASSSFCSTALLTFGVDQTYAYIACGPVATTDHLFLSPTAAAAAASPSKPSAATSASTSGTSSTSSSTPSSTSSSITPSASSSSSSFASSPVSSVSQGPNSSTIPASSGGSSNSTGAIIGGVIGSLALIGISAIVIFWLRWRHRPNKSVGYTTSARLRSSKDMQDMPLVTKQGGWAPPVELSAHHPISGLPVELPASYKR